MGQALLNFWQDTGFANIQGGQVIMMLVSFVLLYLAIKKGFEPLLLVPIAFGMLLANLPVAGVMNAPITQLVPTDVAHALSMEGNTLQFVGEGGTIVGEFTLYLKEIGGLLYYLFQGDHLGIFPPLIFLGVGAMTDFGPLIANPKSLLLGAAAQFGIYITFAGAIMFGFTAQEASAIGIIGGADGPTAIFLASKLAPQKLGAIAVAAYSYMALVPVIQPPIMKFLTTKKEREIKMEQLRVVSKVEKIIFPIVVTILVALIVPPATALVGMLMLGNLFKESGVVGRLTDTAQNALMNIVTIFLGVTVGATASAEYFLQAETLKIIFLGVIAFSCGTAAGVLLAKLMNKLTGGKLNPLIGSAGVSAVPMAARVSQVEGQKADPSNFLLMHAMGPNVAGVIGSAVSAGVLLSLFG
ncbi:MAG: sodium ion-translocating decarboxylase subunit beta [Clostridiales bacterium]|nr:sodium ion-translocating decarboxylase subunit beta [Clostridiales bacterium]